MSTRSGLLTGLGVPAKYLTGLKQTYKSSFCLIATFNDLIPPPTGVVNGPLIETVFTKDVMINLRDISNNSSFKRLGILGKSGKISAALFGNSPEEFLFLGNEIGACGTNTTRGIMAGGSNSMDAVIQYITLSTLGNSADFGTVSSGGGQSCMGGGSSHIRFVMGGLASPSANDEIGNRFINCC